MTARVIKRGWIVFGLLAALSLLISDGSLVGRTVGRAVRSSIGWNAPSSHSVRSETYQWEGPRPDTLSVDGYTVVVLLRGFESSGGIFFSWSQRRSTSLWVEDEAPDGVSYKLKDPVTLAAALNETDAKRTKPLPAALVSGSIKSHQLDPIGIGADAVAIGALIVAIVGTIQRTRAKRRNTSPA
jgi:hypothetical protein